jgi:hypothetical protein
MGLFICNGRGGGGGAKLPMRCLSSDTIIMWSDTAMGDGGRERILAPERRLILKKQENKFEGEPSRRKSFDSLLQNIRF